MARIARCLDHLKVTEIVDLRDYRSTMMQFMGFDLAPDASAQTYAWFEGPPIHRMRPCSPSVFDGRAAASLG